MTRSPDDLPPAISSMWRLCKLGYRYQPWLLLSAFFLALAAALPDALFALWLKLLAQGVLDHSSASLAIATAGLALSATGTWLLRTVSTRVQRRFRDKVTIVLEAHVAQLQASISTIAHQERPEYLDRLAVLRDQVFVLDHMYMSLFSTCGWILRLVITIALLISINPLLALLAVAALPTVLTATWRPGVEQAARERGAPASRLARHFFTIATTAPPSKEVRLTRIGDRIIERRRAAWEDWYSCVAGTRWKTAFWNTLTWAIFAAAFVGAIVFVASGRHAAPANVLMVLAAGSRLSAYIGATVGEIGFMRGIWLDGSRRLAWLEDYSARVIAQEDLPVPSRITRGIKLDHVSFAYPGTDKLVLDNVNLDLPAGKVVAIVGENGAGKTTLVKLLAKLYAPTAGRILVDGVDLKQVPAAGWRRKMAGAFQDFFRFEFTANRSIGVGHLPRIDDVPAVTSAAARAGADDVIKRLPEGLDTQLGPTWPGGVDVSFGQWQKVALARSFMREEPLLLVLDEPTAALDAETEHALFERYARAAGEEVADRTGQITILVSHRFSTVRMADLIVVLDGARAVEVGTHEELVARQGQYAQLYGLQAAAYG